MDRDIDRDITTGLICAFVVLLGLFLFKSHFLQQEPITKELTEWDIKNYISNLNKQNQNINSENVNLNKELTYLKTTDLVKENEKLRERVHPSLFVLMLILMGIFLGLFIYNLIGNFDKKRDIKGYIQNEKHIKEIMDTKEKDNEKISKINELIKRW